MQTLSVAALETILGGDDEDGGAAEVGGDDGGGAVDTSTYDTSSYDQDRYLDAGDAYSGDAGADTHYGDDASTMNHADGDDGTHAVGDPEHAIDSMVHTPDYPTEAPHIDAPTEEQMHAGPSAMDTYNARVDITQHYADAASPPELFQGGRNDCFNVASINALAAHDPDGLHSLVQETRNPDVLHVTTWDRQGNENPEYVQAAPIRNGATGTDEDIQGVYNATSLLYHPGSPGGDPADAMQRLGADTATMTASDAAHAYQDGQGGAVIGTLSPDQLAHADPATQQAFHELGLHDWHAYQVAGVLQNPEDGRDYAILKNPWGVEHPQPVPVEDLDRYFGGGVVGAWR